MESLIGTLKRKSNEISVSQTWAKRMEFEKSVYDIKFAEYCMLLPVQQPAE